MFRVKQASLLLLLLFFVNGCKLSSDRLDKSSGAESGDAYALTPVVVEGRASKGVLQNALVNLFLFRGSSLGEPVATGTTDMEGRFRLTLDPKFLNQPVLFTVTADTEGTSTMLCDVPSGCDEAAFGSTYLLEDDFELSLLVPSLKRGANPNISLLTHLGAKLVQYENQEWFSGLNQKNVSEADLLKLKLLVASANSRIASRFGIIGDLATQKLIDLTNSQELIEATSESIYYSVMGPGSMEFMLSLAPNASFNQRIDIFVPIFIGSHKEGGNSERYISFADILFGAQSTLSYLQDAYPEINFSSVVSEVNTASGLAERDIYERQDLGESSTTLFLTGFERGRALIKDISQVTASVNIPRLASLTNISSLVDPQVSSAIDQFGFEISAAQIFEGERSDLLFNVLGDVVLVALEVVKLSLENSSIPESINDIPFEYSVDKVEQGFNEEVTHKYSFTLPINGCRGSGSVCPVMSDLGLELMTRNASGNLQDQSILADTFSLKLDGWLNADGLVLVLNESSQVIELQALAIADKSEGESTTLGFALDSAKVRVPFQLLYNQNMEDGLVLNGSLSLDAGKSWFEYSTVESRTPTQSAPGSETIAKSMVLTINELKQFSAALNLSIENTAADKSFIAALSANQANDYVGAPIRYIDETVHVCSGFGVTDFTDCETIAEDSGFKDEEPDNYLGLAASIGFKANLKGLDTPVLIEVSGAREGPEVNRIDRLKLRYPGQAIALTGEFEDRVANNVKYAHIRKIDAVSLDGTHIQWDENPLSGEREGDITDSLNEQIAEIVDMGLWLKVEFENGHFQSFCAQC